MRYEFLTILVLTLPAVAVECLIGTLYFPSAEQAIAVANQIIARVNTNDLANYETANCGSITSSNTVHLFAEFHQLEVASNLWIFASTNDWGNARGLFCWHCCSNWPGGCRNDPGARFRELTIPIQKPN